MKAPHATIFGLMILVVVVAIDCAVVKELFGADRFSPSLTELVIIGILPWANVVGLGAFRLIGLRGRRSARERFWVGFEIFGGAALAVLTVTTLLFTDAIHQIPLLLVDPLHLLSRGPGLAWAAAAIFFLPQFAFAVLGGCLARSFRIENLLTRRRPQAPHIGPSAESPA